MVEETPLPEEISPEQQGPEQPPKPKLQLVYERLVADNIKVPDSFEKFVPWVQDDERLRKLQKRLSTMKGFKVSPDFQTFKARMFEGVDLPTVDEAAGTGLEGLPTPTDEALPAAITGMRPGGEPPIEPALAPAAPTPIPTDAPLLPSDAAFLPTQLDALEAGGTPPQAPPDPNAPHEYTGELPGVPPGAPGELTPGMSDVDIDRLAEQETGNVGQIMPGRLTTSLDDPAVQKALTTPTPPAGPEQSALADLANSFYNEVVPATVNQVGNVIDYLGDAANLAFGGPAGAATVAAGLSPTDEAGAFLRAKSKTMEAYVSPAAKQSILDDPYNPNAWAGLLGQGAGSLAKVAVAGALTGGVGAIATGVGMSVSSVKDAAREAGVSEPEAMVTATVVAPIVGMLEELGLSKLVKAPGLQQALMRTLLTRTLATAGGKITRSAVVETAAALVPAIVKRAAKGAIAEGATEFAQSIVEDGSKVVADLARGNDTAAPGQGRYGTTPTDVLRSAAVSGIAGAALGGPVASLNIGSGKTDTNTDTNATTDVPAAAPLSGPEPTGLVTVRGIGGAPDVTGAKVIRQVGSGPGSYSIVELPGGQRKNVGNHNLIPETTNEHRTDDGAPARPAPTPDTGPAEPGPGELPVLAPETGAAGAATGDTGKGRLGTVEPAVVPVSGAAPVAPAAEAAPAPEAPAPAPVAGTGPVARTVQMPSQEGTPINIDLNAAGEVVGLSAGEQQFNAERVLQNPKLAQAIGEAIAAELVSSASAPLTAANNDPLSTAPGTSSPNGLNPSQPVSDGQLSATAPPDADGPERSATETATNEALPATKEAAAPLPVAAAPLNGKPPGYLVVDEKGQAYEVAEMKEGKPHLVRRVDTATGKAGKLEPLPAATPLREVGSTMGATPTERKQLMKQAATMAMRQEPTAAATSAAGPAPDYNKEPAVNRANGRFIKDAVTYERQPVLGPDRLHRGSGVKVEFATGVDQAAQYAVVEAGDLQPSHTGGTRNLTHFLPDAQPKNRDANTNQASEKGIQGIAAAPDLGKASQSPNAYTGAPVVNARGEVIQGNGRSDGIRRGYQQGTAADYQQQLVAQAAAFGLDPAAVAGMKAPVLVRVADVNDAKAVQLGGYTATSTESGGKERLTAESVAQRLTGTPRDRFFAILTEGAQGATTLNDLVRGKAAALVDVLSRSRLLSDSQRQGMFETSNPSDLTAAGANDLENVVLAVFLHGDAQLIQLADELPVGASSGLRRALPDLLSVPHEDSITDELQNAIIGSYSFQNELSKQPYVAGRGRNLKTKAQHVSDVMRRWSSQYDFAKGGKANSELYTPFELKLIELFASGKAEEIAKILRTYALDVKGSPGNMFDAGIPGQDKTQASTKLLASLSNGNPQPTGTKPGTAPGAPRPSPASAMAEAQPAAAQQGEAAVDGRTDGSAGDSIATEAAAAAVQDSKEMAALDIQKLLHLRRILKNTQQRATSNAEEREEKAMGIRQVEARIKDTIEEIRHLEFKADQGNRAWRILDNADKPIKAVVEEFSPKSTSESDGPRRKRTSTPPAQGDQRNAASTPQVSPLPPIGGTTATQAALFNGRILPAGITPAPDARLQPLKTSIADFTRATGLQVLFSRQPGGKRSGASGSYNPGNAGIRLRGGTDLDTFAHEVGHYLDDQHQLLPTASPAALAELDWFAQYGSQAPAGHPNPTLYEQGEGVAEFIRAYVANPVAAEQAAPAFTDHFLNTVPARILEPLAQFSTDYRTFAGATALQQIGANVRTSAPAPLRNWLGLRRRGEGGPIRWHDQLAAAWTDSLQPFKRAVEWAAGTKQLGRLAPEFDPYVLSRVYAGFADKFDNLLRLGLVNSTNERVTDPTNGQVLNLQYLLEPFDNSSQESIARELDMTMRLMVAQRVDERGELHRQQLLAEQAAGTLPKDTPITAHFKAGIGGGIFDDVAVAQKALQEIEQLRQTNPNQVSRLEEAARRYRAFADQSLQYLVEKGRLSQEQYDAIIRDNTQYVALKRVMDSAPDAEINVYRPGGGGLATPSETVHRIKGSDREIENPYLSLLDAANRSYQEADRNEIMLAFRELFRPERDMYDGDLQELAKLASPGRAGEVNTVRIFVDGKAEHWRLDPDLYKVLGPSPGGGSVAFDWLKIPAKILRWTVTNSPVFALRNRVRDFQNRLVVTTTGAVQGLDIYRDGKLRQQVLDEYERFGGGQSGHYLKDEQFWYTQLDQTIRELSKEKKFILADPKRLLNSAGDWYHRLLGSSETAGRLEEYRSAFKQAKKEGLDDYNASLYAAFQARDLMDFAVAGQIGRQINQYVPFFNAGVQGLRRGIRSAQENPRGFLLRWAVVCVVPAMLNRYLVDAFDRDDEYQRLPAYQRDMAYNFPLPGNRWLTLPKPFELGVLASGVERLLDEAVYGNGKAFEGYAASLKDTMLPVDQASAAGPLREIVEQSANYDFFRDKPIVPAYEADVALELRDGTGRASRLGQAVQQLVGIDARRVDHVVNSSFSYFGGWATKLSNTGRDDARGFGLPETGFIKEGNLSADRDVQWVQQQAAEFKLTHHRDLRNLGQLLKQAYAATDEIEKARLERAALDFASRVRQNWEGQDLLQLAKDHKRPHATRRR